MNLKAQPKRDKDRPPRTPERAQEIPKTKLELPNGIVMRNLATLDPGYFALVMGSGIVSVGADLLGYSLISRIVLAATIIAFVVLLVAYAARTIWFWPWFTQSLRDPTTAMAYFTIVAGSNVLGIRLLMAGLPLWTAVLTIFSSLVWLVLTYGLPSFIVASARRPILREINGTWLIWVVATQSLAIVTAGLAPIYHNVFEAILPPVAVSLWGLGVMLYLILIVIIFARLLLVEVTPSEMGPAYWIAMGATAISARAAAGIVMLRDPHSQIIISAMKPFIIGLSTILWAFGTWWIPLLVLFGLWRYIARGYSRAYEPRLWSMVFPLGMYTVASNTLGKSAKLDFMVSISRVWVWVGILAWLAVLALMTIEFFIAMRRRQPTDLPRNSPA